MPDGFEYYKTYLAISNHFTRNYDYFKYSGSFRVKRETFERRNDKYFFEKAAKKFTRNEYVERIVSQYITPKSTTFWIGGLFDGNAETRYRRYVRVIESLEYIFRSELYKIAECEQRFSFNEKSTKHPAIYRLFLINETSLETVCILDAILQFTDKWRSDMLLDEYKKLISDYSPFLFSRDIDLAKYRTIVKEILC